MFGFAGIARLTRAADEWRAPARVRGRHLRDHFRGARCDAALTALVTLAMSALVFRWFPQGDNRRGAPVRVPLLVWDRRHNVASLTVSFARRIWDTREVGDLLLGYAATGRLARVVFLDPRRTLVPHAGAAEAVSAALALLGSAGVPQRDLDVLRSAHRRASALGA